MSSGGFFELLLKRQMHPHLAPCLELDDTLVPSLLPSRHDHGHMQWLGFQSRQGWIERRRKDQTGRPNRSVVAAGLFQAGMLLIGNRDDTSVE